MSKCQDCKNEMLDHKSCFKRVYSDGKRLYNSIPYGEGEETKYIDVDSPDYRYCHDCAVKKGQQHHYGCDMENCPKCGGQLISCGCDLSIVDQSEEKETKINYQFGVKATDKHDAEVATIEASNLKEAKKEFAKSFPDDVDNIDVITSDNGYEEIR